MQAHGAAPLEPQLQEAVLGRVRVAGIAAAAREIGLAQDTVARCAKGETVHRGTRAIVQAWATGPRRSA